MMAFSHSMGQMIFLLTPLREGRRCSRLCSARARRAFLLTPLREGRRRCPIWSTRSAKFLLTPLREGRQSGTAPSGPSQRDFYSRPCGRGDPLVAASTTALHNISTHAPAGGATCSATVAVAIVLPFLLTPLREGRHSFPVSRYSPFAISTHAPAGGATGELANAYKYLRISTHAPAGGATVEKEKWTLNLSFLLTPLREGRRVR